MPSPTPALYILLALIICAFLHTHIHAQTPSISSSTTNSTNPVNPVNPVTPANSPAADTLFASARTAAGQAKYDQAQTLFANFIARHPNDPRAPLALYLRGDCLYRIKNKERETNEV